MKVAGPEELLERCLEEAEKLSDPRILVCLGHLAQIAWVSFSNKTQTACIRFAGGRYRIDFSPIFVAGCLETSADALFVLLHEIGHKIHGDLLRVEDFNGSELRKNAANIVADIRINGELCRLFFPQGVPLLGKLYDEDKTGALLLLPPFMLLRKGAWEEAAAVPREDVIKAAKRRFRRAGRKPADADALARWYVEAWLTPASHQGLLDRLLEILGDEEAPCFLGEHEPGEDPELADWGDLFSKEAGKGDEEEEDEIVPVLPTQRATELHERIRRALEPDTRNPRQVFAVTNERGVVPGSGRREAFLQAAGVWPVFFESAMPARVDDEQRVHVYIDVSGSTSEAQPVLYGLVVHLGELVGQPVYLFSNTVAPVSLKELRDGKRKSTGGTDFDCIVNHAVRNRFRKVLVVTDGYGGLEPQSHVKLRRERVRVYLLLTTDCDWCPLKEHARETWRLRV